MMIEKCRGKKLKDIPKEQNFEYERGVFLIEDNFIREEIFNILLHNKYIPQEALNMYDLEV